jgi:hypothetical protein
MTFKAAPTTDGMKPPSDDGALVALATWLDELERPWHVEPRTEIDKHRAGVVKRVREKIAALAAKTADGEGA